MKTCPFCAEDIQDGAVLCRFCNRRIRPSREGLPLWAVAAGIAIVLGGGIGAYLVAQGSPRSSAPGAYAARLGISESLPLDLTPLPPPPPSFQMVLDSAFSLSAGEHLDTLVAVTDTRPCVLRGRVVGLSGGSRDVEVAVFNEDAYANWHDGVESTPLFESGRTAAVTMEVPLPSAGSYALVISNEFSLFTGKTVHSDGVEIVCGE